MTQGTTESAAAVPLPSPKERRRLREAQSLSEEQVATAMGVTRATVRSWETGRTSPKGRRREAYAKLIGFAEEPPPKTPAAPADRTGTQPSVEAPGSTTMSPTEPDTGMDAEKSTEAEPTEDLAGASGPTEELADTSGTSGISAEEAFDALYTNAAPGLVRQAYLMTGRRSLSRESVEHAFQLAWQRWPEVAVDRDPAGWVRAAAYEYAMSPWHQLRRAHRHPDAPPTEPKRKALFDALLDLPPAYRRTLLLYDGVGLDLPETAAETEASTPAAAGRLMTARAAVAEALPELSEIASPGEQSALLHDRLGALALAEHVPAPAPARAVRTGSERKARLWTRAAIAFAALLVGTTALTLHTAPTQYEQPLAPAERVGGVPPRGGPQKLTPQDLKLQKALRGELVHGPERLVPQLR
ncbi:helix-turn-helix domain-containing protein [Streptomyces sp. NPDC055749]